MGHYRTPTQNTAGDEFRADPIGRSGASAANRLTRSVVAVFQ